MECNPGNINTMEACVLEVSCGSLLVCDLSSRQEVVVNTSRARCFCPGDRVIIEYTGIMAPSEPPQISAVRIYRAACGCR